MNQTTKLLLTLRLVDGILKLIKGNEYEKYLTTFIAPVNAELNRQLTNLKQSSKMKE